MTRPGFSAARGVAQPGLDAREGCPTRRIEVPRLCKRPTPGDRMIRYVVTIALILPTPIFAAEIAEAEKLLRTGKYDDALALLAEIKKKGKPDSLTVLLEADALIGKGDTAAAAAKYDEAVSLFPTDPVVFLRRGQSLMNKKETSGEAIDDFTRALQLRPEMWQALQYRGRHGVGVDGDGGQHRDGEPG